MLVVLVVPPGATSPVMTGVHDDGLGTDCVLQIRANQLNYTEFGKCYCPQKRKQQQPSCQQSPPKTKEVASSTSKQGKAVRTKKIKYCTNAPMTTISSKLTSKRRPEGPFAFERC